MKDKLKGVVGESSIVLHYGGEAITIQASTDRLLFEEFKDLIRENNSDKLVSKFLDVKSRIEKYTDKNFYVKEDRIFIKGDDQPIPDKLALKLLELETTNQDFMPLIRFWKKLKQNPSPASIEQLYGFIEHNNIPITEMGDIVTEKGVKQRTGAPVGELVDDRTGLVDNSIGMEVFMDRDKVDSNPNQTCSFGLHVGAPDYVRKHYSNNIIIQCIVNPRDVVAVPTDYNNTKMRVCRYVSAGYSANAEYKPIYKLSDFIGNPPEDLQKDMISLSSEKVSKEKEVKKDKDVKSVITKKHKNVNELLDKFLKKFSSMTGKAIIAFVSKNYNVELPHNPKSKTAIVKKAAKIAADHEEINKK
jgi:hypothetical protein